MLLGWRVRWKNSFRDFSGVVVGQSQDVCDVFEFCEEELFTLPTRTVTQVTPALLQYATHRRTKLLKVCDNSSTILEIHDTVIGELSALAGDKAFDKALQEAIKVEVALKATAERDMIVDQSDEKATKSGVSENEHKGCKGDAKEEVQKPTSDEVLESSSEDEDSSNNSSDAEEEEEEEEDDSEEDEEEDSSDDSNSSGDSSGSSEEDSSSSEDEESKVDIKVHVLPSNDIRGFSVHLTEAGLRTIQKALKKDYGKIASIFFRDSDGDAIVIKSLHDFKYASNSAKAQLSTDGSARNAVLKLKLFAETSDFQNSQQATADPTGQGASSHCSTVPFVPASQVNFAGQGKESTTTGVESSGKSRGVTFGGSTPSAQPSLHNSPSLHNAPSQSGIHHGAALNYEVVWKKGELLGSGSFGKVYSGMNLGSGERLAVKEVVLRRGKKHRQQAQALQLEVKILSSLDHPNIIKYLGTEYTKQTLRIFLELANDGTIKDALNEFGAFPESLVRRYTSDIVEGLWFLHSKKFIHRDIKPTNLLVSGGRVKLGDFGCSTSIVEDESILDGSHNTVAGTAVYMAPEVMQAGDDVDLTALASQAHTGHTGHTAPGKGSMPSVNTNASGNAQGSVLVRRRKGYGKRADIWSVGITLVEMATGRAPYANASAAIYAVCMSKQYPSFPAQFSPVAHNFLQRCLVEDPKLRATSAELRLLPFLNAQSADEVRSQTAAMPRTAHTTSTVTVHLPEDFSFLQSPRNGGEEVTDSRESENHLAGRHKLESKISSFTGTDWFRTATTAHTTYNAGNAANRNAGRVQTAPAGAQRRMDLDDSELSPSAARQKLWSRTQVMDPLGVESKMQTEFSDSDSDPSPSRDDPFRSAGSSMFYSAPVHRSEGYEDESRGGGDRAAYLTARSVSQDEDMFQRIEDLPRALEHSVKLDSAAVHKDAIRRNKGTRGEQKSHDFYSAKECDEDEDCKTGFSTFA